MAAEFTRLREVDELSQLSFWLSFTGNRKDVLTEVDRGVTIYSLIDLSINLDKLLIERKESTFALVSFPVGGKARSRTYAKGNTN